MSDAECSTVAIFTESLDPHGAKPQHQAHHFLRDASLPIAANVIAELLTAWPGTHWIWSVDA